MEDVKGNYAPHTGNQGAISIFKKIHNAKTQIKETKLKKMGWNSYSEYHYFLPEQIEQLVFEVCKNLGLLTKFDLQRNELGEVGVLTVIDIETGDSMTYTMATAIPAIKATNLSQQLGGCMTYTERYLKMTAFGISENGLDFDGLKPNVEQPESEKGLKATNFDGLKPNAGQSESKKWLNATNFDGTINERGIKTATALAEKRTTWSEIEKDYKVSQKDRATVNTHLNETTIDLTKLDSVPDGLPF